MKLAEALSLRKAQNDQLNTILRAISSAAYSPEEKPEELLAKYFALHTKQMRLIQSITRTNNQTVVNHETLSELRTERDMLIEASKKLDELPTRKLQSRGSTVPPESLAYDAVKLRTTIDDFSRRAREIDNLIQQTNWNVDLL